MFKAFKKLFITKNDIEESTDLLRIINQLQSNIETSLAPLTSNIQNDSTLLTNISLTTGLNKINHLLNRQLSGWKIIRQRGAASIYDTQDSNLSPQLTLWLNTSANVIVDIEVF